jgi:hypothetical protein
MKDNNVNACFSDASERPKTMYLLSWAFGDSSSGSEVSRGHCFPINKRNPAGVSNMSYHRTKHRPTRTSDSRRT